MGIVVHFLSMGNAGFISSTVLVWLRAVDLGSCLHVGV